MVTVFSKTKSFIKVRTQFEGFHYYPDAGKIDNRIEFLEHRHRHMFHVCVKMSVTHQDRELEFFLVKWELDDFIKATFVSNTNMSCEMMAEEILSNHLIPLYGDTRDYTVTVSEDGEFDGIVEYQYLVNGYDN